jgi:HSP20 family protein
MTTMYSKNHIMPRALGSLIEDIFNNGINKVWGEEGLTDRSDAPVNIQETDKCYELHLIAPGLKKEDFKINIDRNILTISFEHKEEETEQIAKWLRKEYKMKSFKRSFTLNEKIDSAGITARYTDGVLNVSLPKKEQPELTAQEINVQ